MTNRRLWGYFLLMSLVVLLTGVHVAQASTSITDSNGWTVTFVSRVYNSSNKTTTFTYTVAGTDARRDLSNFVVALPMCSPSFTLLSYSPTRAVTRGLDPKSGLNGIKWDLGVPTAGAQTYSFTYSGNTPLGTTHVSTKAGTSIALTTLPGAACEWPRGKIIVKKVTAPAGDAQSFAFTPSYGAAFNLTDGQTNTSAPLTTPGSYSVSETVPSGWDQTSATCDNGNPPSAISLAPGQTVTCTFTNTKRATARLIKTVTNATGTRAPSGSQAFTFELRQGASASAAGSLVETQVANAANGGNIAFSALLVPGAYQMCEVAVGGWHTNLPDPFTLFGTTDTQCTSFTLAAGEAKTLSIDNADTVAPLCPTSTIQAYWQKDSLGVWQWYVQQTTWDEQTGIASIIPVAMYPASAQITYNGQTIFGGVGPSVPVAVKGDMFDANWWEANGGHYRLRVLVTDHAGNALECDPDDVTPGP